MVPALITTFLWSTSVIAARRSVALLGENQANLARILVALMVLGFFAHLWGGGLSGAGFWFFFLSGIIGFGLGDIGIFYALPRIGSRLTLLMAQCLAAPIAGFLEWAWLGTTVTPFQLFAVAVILMGIVLALAPGELAVAHPKRFIAGLLFGLLAALGQGGGAVLSRKGYSLGAISEGLTGPDLAENLLLGVTTGYQRLLGGTLVILGFYLLSFVIRAWQSHPQPGAGEVGMSRKAAVVMLNAASGPILGIVCYQWALATTPTALVQPIVAMTPIVVIPMAWWWEGDRPRPRSVLGGLISVVGVVLLAFG
ncbi:MAG: hypothetical protein RL648_809 [Verrucomicrobiota bacterium]|jgi:drug/metabolite transporter (DMT)-like permease